MLTNWYIGDFGLGGFSLKTGFPDYPLTLPYYRVIGEDEQEFGTLEQGFGPENPPTEEEAVLIAQDYLEFHDLLPEDAVLEYIEMNVVKKSLKAKY